MISVSGLNKVYDDGFQALKNINLDIQKQEIFALLGPNGAGKTTLINSICGIVNPTGGTVKVNNFDTQKEFRKTRALIGLVPQELTTDAFESVWNTVSFSRGLFGLAKNPDYIEKILKELSLWDKKDNRLMTLSGGMKRRVLIAKALSHEPQVLFLDEPTAGVDVELRQGMWEKVRSLRESGVTVILTTHYIEEAEEMADRIGVINNGEIIVVEDKKELMKKFGKKQLTLDLKSPIEQIPQPLNKFELILDNSGSQLRYTYDASSDNNGIAELLEEISKTSIKYRDLNTHQSSLEEIFVKLVNK